HDENVAEEEEINWKQQMPKKKKERVMRVLDQKTITTRHGSYNRYLVQWE
ncbi:hypothetical protein KI387_040231, partial [Taxus chinensis]